LIRHGEGKKPLTPFQSRRTDAIIAVSNAAGEAMRRLQPQLSERIQVIRNGVELSCPLRSRAEIRVELGLGESPVGIIVARLDRLKGHDVLLRALALLQEKEIPFNTLIVGDGPEGDSLTRQASELRLGPDRVRFLGYRNDITDLLAASDLFLLPSRTEGLPLSVLEAMAQRLPVIATPVGGIPEVVQEQRHGLFVPVDRPDALADAVAQIAKDQDLRREWGQSAYREVQAHHSFQTMVERYDTLYQSLLPA
jgi:glycosyltransferase involved in cell wall biosynthesis